MATFDVAAPSRADNASTRELTLDAIVHRIASLQEKRARLVCAIADPAGWRRIEEALSDLRGELARRAGFLRAA